MGGQNFSSNGRKDDCDREGRGQGGRRERVKGHMAKSASRKEASRTGKNTIASPAPPPLASTDCQLCSAKFID